MNNTRAHTHKTIHDTFFSNLPLKFLNSVPFRHENNWCYWYLSFHLHSIISLYNNKEIGTVYNLFYLMLRIWIGFYPAHLGYAVPFINLGLLLLLFEKPFVVMTTSSWSVVRKKRKRYIDKRMNKIKVYNDNEIYFYVIHTVWIHLARNACEMWWVVWAAVNNIV